MWLYGFVRCLLVAILFFSIIGAPANAVERQWMIAYFDDFVGDYDGAGAASELLKNTHVDLVVIVHDPTYNGRTGYAVSSALNALENSRRPGTRIAVAPPAVDTCSNNDWRMEYPRKFETSRPTSTSKSEILSAFEGLDWFFDTALATGKRPFIVVNSPIKILQRYIESSPQRAQKIISAGTAALGPYQGGYGTTNQCLGGSEFVHLFFRDNGLENGIGFGWPSNWLDWQHEMLVDSAWVGYCTMFTCDAPQNYAWHYTDRVNNAPLEHLQFNSTTGRAEFAPHISISPTLQFERKYVGPSSNCPSSNFSQDCYLITYDYVGGSVPSSQAAVEYRNRLENESLASEWQVAQGKVGTKGLSTFNNSNSPAKLWNYPEVAFWNSPFPEEPILIPDPTSATNSFAVVDGSRTLSSFFSIDGGRGAFSMKFYEFPSSLVSTGMILGVDPFSGPVAGTLSVRVLQEPVGTRGTYQYRVTVYEGSNGTAMFSSRAVTALGTPFGALQNTMHVEVDQQTLNVWLNGERLVTNYNISTIATPQVMFMKGFVERSPQCESLSCPPVLVDWMNALPLESKIAIQQIAFDRGAPQSPSSVSETIESCITYRAENAVAEVLSSGPHRFVLRRIDIPEQFITVSAPEWYGQVLPVWMRIGEITHIEVDDRIVSYCWTHERNDPILSREYGQGRILEVYSSEGVLEDKEFYFPNYHAPSGGS
ncbi:MAG: hypothetical protein KDD70_06520 [Bdellovibrionales bacterium]|nr:hypothetical protein [Bdellovibrionales bacterium]